MMPTQIRRKQGPLDFIPAYSTDELLRGVCHITKLPRSGNRSAEATERIKKLALIGAKKGGETRKAMSRAKFEKNKKAIYEMLASGRGVCATAAAFRLGDRVLKKYLEEE